MSFAPPPPNQRCNTELTCWALQDLELVVFDGALDVEETIALFKRAVMVIGPHGAGMTNLLWTSAGTRIVEFLHMTYPLLCYWHMATGIFYWFFFLS